MDFIQLPQAVQGPVSPDLEYFQEWDRILLTGFLMLLAISELLKEMQLTLADLNQEIIKDLGIGKFDMTVAIRLMT